MDLTRRQSIRLAANTVLYSGLSVLRPGYCELSSLNSPVHSRHYGEFLLKILQDGGPIPFQFAMPGSNVSELLHHMSMVLPLSEEVTLSAYESVPSLKMTSIGKGTFHIGYDFGARFLRKRLNGDVEVSSGLINVNEAHPHQSLAAFATAGFALDKTIQSGYGPIAIRTLFGNALNSILSGDTDGLDWFLMAFAAYALRDESVLRLIPTSSLRSLCRTLMTANGRLACYGIHRLIALKYVYILDQRTDRLRGKISNEVSDFLKTHERIVLRSQRKAGYWTPDWNYILADNSSNSFDQSLYPRYALALATSHIYDWLVFGAVENNQLSETRQIALSWISEIIRDLNPDEFFDHYCPFSHCVKLLLTDCLTIRHE